MRENATQAINLILRHEGGFVDHPRDPGGATNKGVTIGTLRRLGIDKDGDGDSDVVDLKALTNADVHRIYKTFYWDAVQADLLPGGVDYTVADFAVNSGPSRAAKHLQRAVGATADGHIGPLTLAAVEKADPRAIIEAIHDSRLAFLQRLRHWPVFKNGWTRRVHGVRETSIAWLKPRNNPDASVAIETTVLPEEIGGMEVSVLAELMEALGFVRREQR